MKTKIGTEVAHFTRDSDTTFKFQGQKVKGVGHIVAASRTACLIRSAAAHIGRPTAVT